WLADSAATRHVTKYRPLFSTYTETPGATVTGFSQSPSLGTRTAEITSHIGKNAYPISLKNSMHVPDSPYNLISIGCMT
ncbi:hypothetical protein C8R45DRAFT_758741, partial [Mycena sanguinolenta]